MDKIYTILFKDKDMKRAAMIEGKQKADRIAAEIREDFPDAVVTVKPF